MSEDTPSRLELKTDEHDKRLHHLETGHAVNDERHKTHDKRLSKLEINWSWVIKTILALVIGGVITVFLNGGVS